MCQRTFLSLLSVFVSFLWVTVVSAKDFSVSVEIPALNVAEYHRPYVAIWVERESGKSIPLSVWYQLEERGEKSDKGEEWLKDMRQWWRRIGRGIDMPVDGVSGATRVSGVHHIHFSEGKAPLGVLAAGQYFLLIEAAREVGGHEIVKLPFVWPVKNTFEQTTVGHKELGKITLSINP